MKNTVNLNAQTSCFWNLLQEKDVIMPLYQRDYVQGRADDAATLIRTEFVADLVGAVTNTSHSVALHFVFGGRDNNQDGKDAFVPVDGQQRLTALFLLHWYVLFQGGATEQQRERMLRFQYKSRDTSARFCRELVMLLTQEELGTYNCISELIKDRSWFTGNISLDPTVASMLVVLDEIQSQFDKLETADWEIWKNRLLTEDVNTCPITFLRLDMENALGHGSEIRDLYVKMNDRGKLLTDFENFKAYLHKAIRTGDDRFDLLHACLGEKDSESERIKLLGKINNDYTDFFFRALDDGNIYDYSCEDVLDKNAPQQKFDAAMMNYFNEMIRMEFFRYINSCVKKESYRNDGKVIAEMSGKAFYTFITSSAKEYRESYGLEETAKATIEDQFKNGFNRALKLLDVFTSNKDMLLGEIEQPGSYSTLSLVKECALQKTNASLAASRAMFAFIEKFGLRDQKDPLFYNWSRFVWRCITFIEFEHFNDACSVGDALERIVESLPNTSLPADLWRTIASFSIEVLNCTLLEQHFKEERIKAKLLSEAPAIWERRIQEAEQWNQSGQIYYLLELAQQSDGTYSEVGFDSYFEFFKSYFHCPDCKSIVFKDCVDSDTHRSFENALLLSSTNAPYYHLLKKQNGNQMIFSYQNYWPILSTNKAEEIPHQTIYQVVRSVVHQAGVRLADKLKNLSTTLPTLAEDDWRICFLQADLYALRFPESSKMDTAICMTEDNYCRLYKEGKQQHTSSAEIHAAVVYCRLRELGKEATLKLDTKDHHLQNDDIPARCVVCEGKKIFYKNGKYYIDSDTTAYTLENVLDKYKTP